LRVIPVNLSRCAGLGREADRRETRSGEGDGLAWRTLYLFPAGPITLTLGASHLDHQVKRPEACLSRSRGRGF
jgi:hypothetical protein